jgi:photosystem II stability/assembly factor-like uncharacterized protein
MKILSKASIVFLLFFLTIKITAQNKSAEESKPDSLKNVPLIGLSFRSIGPALTGGRVVALAVNPFDHNEYFVGAGHGSLWKTVNNGITFTPVFDHEKAYAIGAVSIDPTNPNVVWVGTGENDNQNNVIYGDGVYKSEDGGKTWKDMGIKNSEQIGGIVIDPKDPNTVYVATYGSLRKAGGDRGIFKTTDGGKTWKNVLFISKYTGCYEIHVDPRYDNLLYAVAHQRMRKLYTGVSGGPESGIYRSTDSGTTWNKMTQGLPSGDVGRIGLAISPVNPDVLFAIVEAEKDGGVYKSTDRGVSWTKESSYVSAYPFYFQKLFCDTKDVDRIYSMDVFMKVSIDGGKTWKNLGEENKHVDNHVLWIDPTNNKHMIDGCDGGVYDTYDQGKNWAFKSNIPIAEIYKVTTDNDTPFYNVYGGSQDNSSFCGPSRTINTSGITNQDWFFTDGGDGFQTQVDWKNPNIIYSQSQFGGLVRFDKKSGEMLYIKPYDFSSDTSYRFDWDAALLISKFDNKRLYFGGNKLFRTDDRGDSWEVISPDLTRGVPKEMQKLMDHSWSVDDLAHKSPMAQISTIAESPLDENLLFVGSGDGLIHVTTDGGKTWIKSSTAGLPEYARISQISASYFNRKVAYAACQNLVDGDYKPYLYKTTNGGDSWFLHNGNLPDTGSTYSIVQDDVDKDLLFVGTQFGVYFSADDGNEWIQLKNGIPTECITDMTIQRREHDLVASTFGRGIYILDDYTPLRYLNEDLTKEAAIFPIKDALMYIEANPFVLKGVGFQGASFFSAPNPPFGAVFTYYLKNDIKSLKEQRRDKEKKEQKKGEDIKYPSYQRLLSEKEEPESYLLFTITDEQGNVIRKLKTEAHKGVNRIVWDFRYAPFNPVSLKEPESNAEHEFSQPDLGYMVVPGKYKVSLSKYEDGKFTELVKPQEFTCKQLHNATLPAEDKFALDKFNKKVADLTRAVSGADAYRKYLDDKIDYLEKAVIEGADVPDSAYNTIISIKQELDAFNRKLNGNPLRTPYEGAAPTSLKDRIDLITSSLWTTTSAPTTTYIKSYDFAANQFGGLLNKLKSIDDQVKAVESRLEKYGAPYTPGRFPVWEKDVQ